MRLRVKNKTHYSTADLRALIGAGLRALGDDRLYTVTVVYVRNSATWTSGYAYYNSGTIRLRVPRGKRDTVSSPRIPYNELPAESVADLAKTLAHEIAHTNGVGHREMDCCHKRKHMGGTDDAPTPWADGLRVRAKQEAPKPEAGAVVADRAAHATAMLEKWERKHKAAMNKIRRWRRTVTYYEKKAAAKGRDA